LTPDTFLTPNYQLLNAKSEHSAIQLFSSSVFPTRSMTDLAAFTAQLATRCDLASTDATAAATALASAGVTNEAKAAFLVALAAKGETAAELAAFATAFRVLAVDPGMAEWAPRAIDIVGTGGDHAGGFNVSSLVVLVLASAGVPVMKHGNRGITSKCGSADLFAAFGVDLAAPPAKLRQALTELGYVFFFAPNYHPAFQHVAPVRKALAAQGQRTIFNSLGPLLNPGRPAHALVGVFSEAGVPKLAGALGSVGLQAGLVGHGLIDAERGIDELTTATVNRVRGFGRLANIDGRWLAEDFGLRPAPFSELVGGDLAANLALVDALLDGRGPAGLADTIVLNAAVGLWICGRTAGVKEGLAPMRELLLGGEVRKKIAATREFYRT
jgi:anthranilate phosphoribosyltransferase